MKNLLKRDFYLRDAITVSKDLLGKLLVHEIGSSRVSGKIVEVEAYMGPDDAAAHSYKKRNSKRTNIQYGEGGFAYIYMIYGLHFCFNVVTNIPQVPQAVLIRALEPVEGTSVMLENRGVKNSNQLTNGPGKLCKALGIDNSHYGLDLCGSSLYIEEYEKPLQKDIIPAKRVNVDYAGEAKDYLWRFYISGNKHVSVV
ncbi:MAG: DNA-3-methyladenine glycosylase [Oscillospiraceae bacterium]|nr:DNA-3-methyladenine glycosylase [Oscillospiraceae bacterium]